MTSDGMMSTVNKAKSIAKKVITKGKKVLQDKATQIMDDMDGTTYAKNTMKRMTPEMKENMQRMNKK